MREIVRASVFQRSVPHRKRQDPGRLFRLGSFRDYTDNKFSLNF
jgi:hypothetical protein